MKQNFVLEIKKYQSKVVVELKKRMNLKNKSNSELSLRDWMNSHISINTKTNTP